MAENSASDARQRLAGLQHRLRRIERVEHVVAGQRRDAHLQAEPARERDDRLGSGDRVRGAHIGDDAHAVLLDQRQQAGHAPFEQRVVAVGRIVQPAQLRERDGALAEALQHQVVELAALGEDERGLEPVALEARAAADPDVSANAQSPGSVDVGEEQVLPLRRRVLHGPDLAHEHRGLEHLLGLSVKA